MNPYEPSAVSADGTVPVEVPGLVGRIAVAPAGVFSGHRLYVDGQLAPTGSGWGASCTKQTIPP